MREGHDVAIAHRRGSQYYQPEGVPGVGELVDRAIVSDASLEHLDQHAEDRSKQWQAHPQEYVGVLLHCYFYKKYVIWAETVLLANSSCSV